MRYTRKFNKGDRVTFCGHPGTVVGFKHFTVNGKHETEPLISLDDRTLNQGRLSQCSTRSPKLQHLYEVK